MRSQVSSGLASSPQEQYAFAYRAHGLNIASQIELPMLPGATPGSKPDLRIRLGPVDREHAAGNGLRRRNVFDQMYYELRAGAELVIEPLPGSDPASIADLVVSRLLTTAIYQRGMLPLHASAVLFGDALVAICGESGDGKSTLAAMLIERGGQLLADDMLVVTREPPFCAAGPGAGAMKLSGLSLSQLGRAADGLERANRVEEKFILPVETVGFGQPVIAALVQLRAGEPCFAQASPLDALSGWKKCVRMIDLMSEAPDPGLLWQNWVDLVANTGNIIVAHGGRMEVSASHADRLASLAQAGTLRELERID